MTRPPNHGRPAAGIERAISQKANLLSKSMRAEQLPSDRTVPAADPAMFPGIVGELVRAAKEVCEACEASVAAQFLVAFGNLAGRGPHLMVGETRHGVNEFLAIVGPTAEGGKGDARQVAFAPLREAEPEWAMRAGGGLSSGEGVIEAVRDPVSKPNKQGRVVLVDEGAFDKRLCLVETEFSKALKMFRREGNILSEVLREGWDGTSLRTRTRETSRLTATDPHISLIAHTSPEDLRAHLTDLDIANGLGNRFLFVAVRRVRDLPAPSPMPAALRQHLVSKIQTALTHAQTVGFVERTPRASRLWTAIYSQLKRPGPGLHGVLLMRGAAHVTRLALLFALLDCSSQVDEAHLLSAVAWWDYCRASVDAIFGDRTGNDVADRIRASLPVGCQMTLSAIRQQLFTNKCSQGALDAGLHLLAELGDVVMTKQSTAGRPATMVTRIERGGSKASGGSKATLLTLLTHFRPGVVERAESQVP